MEYKIVKNWLVESTIMILVMDISGIVIGLLIEKWIKGGEFPFVVLFVIYPFLNAMFIGNKLHTYSEFGFSRMQYFKNIALFNITFSIELAFINVFIVESMLRFFPEDMLGKMPFGSLSIIENILYMVLYFNLMYSLVFLDISRKKPILTVFGRNHNILNNSRNQVNHSSGALLYGMAALLFMSGLLFMNIVVEYIVSIENQFLGILFYTLMTSLIVWIYSMGYKKILRKELA